VTERRILVAASGGIAAESWLERKLRESIPEGSVVSEIGRNKHLSNALAAIGVASEPWTKTTALRKSEIRSALDAIDHLLLFWDGRSFTNLLFEARLRNIPTKVLPIQVTEVVNKERDNDFDAYIGRGTPWGNPFHVGKQEGQFERDEAIEKYKEHFEKNILGDEGKRRGLLGLRGMRIACHCKPLACHGDVIAGYLNALDPDDLDPV
jgi:hypothetical protein